MKTVAASKPAASLRAKSLRSWERDRRRAQEAEANARHEKRLAPIMARLARRCGASPVEIREAAERLVSQCAVDPLAGRLPGAQHASFQRWFSKSSGAAEARTWRADMDRTLAYLFGGCGYGLPLAHEGGRPFRCVDSATMARAEQNWT